MAKIESPDDFMARTTHPLKAEVEVLRTILRGASADIAERVKWNAPSYYLAANPKRDMAAFNLRQQEVVQVVFVFHDDAMIESPLLSGDYKDRRLAIFSGMAAVEAGRDELQRIVRAWVRLASA